ncbi:hypothetical protein [Hydrogenophaga sp.]|uniref:hypothetical protein n=1 Tax=Hydrogenophaga sp. TaxID=1904254 RepID=UPI0019B21868|nr:hypothetical protein [Hydrogenophaga sp.]MBD3892920.1 hypothetical protein [Hydrogenophaga sp.]
MNQTDVFFTHTIVGAPLSVPLGRRLGPAQAQAQGLHVDLGRATQHFCQDWQGWLLLNHADNCPGLPRRRPGRWRRRLERHALWLAVLALLGLLASGVFWGAVAWR